MFLAGDPVTGFGVPDAMMPVASTPIPEPWKSYGSKASTTIIAALAQLPPSQQNQALQNALTTIDPALYSQVQSRVQGELNAGKPPLAALHKALSRSLAEHLVGTLASLGSGQKQLQGLGVSPALIAAASQTVAAFATTAPTTTVATTAAMLPSVSSTMVQPTAQSMMVATPGAQDGSCTSDKKLVWSGGQWRVMAPTDSPTQILPYDSTSILASMVTDPNIKLYVNRFPFDPNATGAYVTELSDPSQFDQGVLQTLFTLAQTNTAARISAGAAGTCDAAIWNSALSGSCSTCMEQSYCLDQANLFAASSSTSNAVCPSPTAAACTTDYQTYLSTVNPTSGGGYYKYPPITAAGITDPLSTGVGGVAGQGMKLADSITAGVDANGSPCHFAQFAGDGNTYTFYTAQDWLAGTGLGSAFDLLQLANSRILIYNDNNNETGLTQLFSCFTNSCHLLKSGSFSNVMEAPSPAQLLASNPPIGQFTHPRTNQPWGLWLALVKDAGPSNCFADCTPGSETIKAGDWNETLDKAESWHFEIGFAPMATVTTWEQIFKDAIEAIFWLPGMLFVAIAQAAAGVVTAVGSLACDAAGLVNPAAISKAAGNNPAGQAVAAGVAIAQAICPSSTPTSPTTTLPIVSATPWYLQWWVLLAAGAGAAYLLWPKGKEEETLSGAKPPPPWIRPKGPPPGVPIHPAMLKGARRTTRGRRGYAR
jgi:hypothetical protein